MNEVTHASYTLSLTMLYVLRAVLPKKPQAKMGNTVLSLHVSQSPMT